MMKDGFIYSNGMQIKANCYACKQLEHIDNTSYEIIDGGFCCNGREYKNQTKQRELELNMQRDKYLKRAKKCCDLKY
tara:strand:- start:322 stop:552 length:231 start_codon:yes stop_codon:yes gene_type:complete